MGCPPVGLGLKGPREHVWPRLRFSWAPHSVHNTDATRHRRVLRNRVGRGALRPPFETEAPPRDVLPPLERRPPLGSGWHVRLRVPRATMAAGGLPQRRGPLADARAAPAGAARRLTTFWWSEPSGGTSGNTFARVHRCPRDVNARRVLEDHNTRCARKCRSVAGQGRGAGLIGKGRAVGRAARGAATSHGAPGAAEADITEWPMVRGFAPSRNPFPPPDTRGRTGAMRAASKQTGTGP